MISNVVKIESSIAGIDTDRRLVFGWASVAFDKEGNQVVDWHNDLIDEDDLEFAAYKFVLHSREGGEMHLKGGSMVLVESVVFTKEKQEAIGIPEGILPIGWWVGFFVLDDGAWEKIKTGSYKMFSIEGAARYEEVEG
ncbi:MAG: XkdF-like putative serine protease domain-containing protein [Thermodesulfovibrionales bacterium]|nr:XkdF-like putative serine protease domain-containing protein [Thermodesulfovibrionales bacterium]